MGVGQGGMVRNLPLLEQARRLQRDIKVLGYRHGRGFLSAVPYRNLLSAGRGNQCIVIQDAASSAFQTSVRVLEI